MQRSDVKIGETYIHKHRTVRITQDRGYRFSSNRCPRYEIHCGWTATNLDTGRDVHIKSAQGLHHRTPKGAVQRIQQAAGQPARPLPLPSLDLHPVELSEAITKATLSGDRTKVDQLVTLREYLWRLVNHARSTGPGSNTGGPFLIWTANEVQKLSEILEKDVAGLEAVRLYPLSTIEVR